MLVGMKRLPLALGLLILILASHGQSQVLVTDLFSGTNSGSTNVAATAGLFAGATTTAAFGPGYTGTATLGGGIVYTLGMDMNASNNGQFDVYGAGVAGVAGTFDATKSFTGVSFATSTTYKLTLQAAAGTNVALLSTLNLKLTEGGTTLMDTSTGTGLGGSPVNVVALFTGTTETFTFTTPSVLNTSLPMVFDINGTSAASLIGGSVTFSGASIAAVPEPSEWALMGLGMVGLLWLRFSPFRRSATV